MPITIIQNDRQQSAVNMLSRMLLRLDSSGVRYSAGIDFRACISELEMKSEKKSVGMRAKSRAMPAVRPKLI